MRFLLKHIGKWVMLLLLIAAADSAHAQTVTVLKCLLDGSKQQIATDSAITVRDSVYFKAALQSKIDTPYQVKNIVTFRINEYSLVYLPKTFSATVQLRIIYTRPDLMIDSVDKSLTINYADTSTYTNKSSIVFNNAHQVTVKILSIAAINAVLPALQVENEMDVRVAYKLSCTDDVVKVISADNPPNTDSTDEITVTWPVTTGADVYDLEWAYIDSSALSRYGSPVDPQLLFQNNATRVTISANSYKIPLMYDNGGILFYRVRAVQEKNGNVRMETSWSSAYTGGLGQYSFVGHQRSLNWQSNISYAEDGKRNVTVEYYDGSLHSRQKVAKDNTTNTILVGESYYDYQGRPVIQVLPSPSLNSVIKYSRNFNTGVNGAEYDKSNYDTLTSATDFLTASAKPMSAGSGANLYYSSSNTERLNGVNQYIPDAGGYAFTEVSYTQDNSGRISRQSGVGPVYRLGSNHETKYSYSTPGDNDLDALFGTEIGDRSHYFKTTMQDANGQYSVVYQDMNGHTVATALSGRPDSANLAALTYNPDITYTDTLSRKNNNIIRDLSLESNNSQLVTVEAIYSFTYKLKAPVLQIPDCNNIPVCYNGLYDLEIKVTDDAFNQRLGGKPFDTIFHNYTTGVIPTDCSAARDFDVAFSLHLPRGVYAISKRLVINKDVLNYYRDSVFLKKNTCTTFEQFVQQQRIFLASTQCIPDCQSCRDSVGTWDVFRDTYMTRAAIEAADSANYRGEALAAYQSAVTACDALCDAASEVNDIQNAMLLDVTAPSGQYANVDDSLSIYSVFYHKDDKVLPPYRRDSVTYLDEAGRKDSVYDASTQTFVLPQKLAPEDFAANFKPSWASALLKFHPEYCKYLEYLRHKASYDWDHQFEIVDDYATAKQLGYLNPTANTAVALPYVIANKDPLAAESTSQQTAIDKILLNYNNGTNNIPELSMWSIATITVKCTGNTTSCSATYNTPAAAFNESTMCTGDLDMAWRTFRELYLATKHNILNDKINNASCTGVAKVTSTQLTTAGKSPNFNSVTDAVNQNGGGYMKSTTDSSVMKDSLNASLQRSYTDNCNSYIKAWLAQLSPCIYYSTSTLNDTIIPRLISVCKGGADLDHPYGSSTVSPSSTNNYKSFQQVLNDYNASRGIKDTLNCNPYLITAPAPYDKQQAYNKIVYSKPGDCECTKITTLRKEYLAKKTINDASFSAYLNRTRGITITDNELIDLLNACSGSTSCTYLEKPITLPPGLQCGFTGETCATCRVTDSLYTLFTVAYPGIIPTKEEGADDSTQQKKNLLFAGFMNNKLGFNKQAWEYLSFREQCASTPPVDGTVPANGVTCAQLTTIRTNFQSLYPESLGSTLSVSKLVPLSTALHIYSSGYPANASAGALAAVVWTSSGWYSLRDNIRFKLNFVASDAVISNAVLNLYPSASAPDVYTGQNAGQYSTQGDTVFSYFDRALSPVKEGVTTWNTQPSVTSLHRITLPQLTGGAQNLEYHPTCTDMVKDMFSNYLIGNDNGLMFRLNNDDASRQHYNGYIFWSNTYIDASKHASININYTASRCEEFTAYVNSQLNTSYTSAQVNSLFVSLCGSGGAGICDNTSYPVISGPLLCGKASALFPTMTDSVTNCADNEFFAVSKGTEYYNAYRDSLKGTFDKVYIDTCTRAGQREIFTVNYTTSEYHYTLYYYDQAGNLIKTVPPAGVVINRTAAWYGSVKAARANGIQKVPAHTFLTQYRYNTLNQVIAQSTPDGGLTKFFYDRLGRMVAKQVASQTSSSNYAYMQYDALGRPVETGAINGSVNMTALVSRNPTALATWMSNGAGTRTLIVRNNYDNPDTLLSGLVLTPRNLRNRVAFRTFYNTAGLMATNSYATATYYSYDIHGNADTVLQDYKDGGMSDGGNRFKKMVYRYDLISGKLNHIAYQPGQPDAMYHRYTYDAQNRTTNVETSRDSIYWENDAFYQYYKHGTLARTVIGQQQVQGLDYAYTLQGWLKGVNSTAVTPSADMGHDGTTGNQVAKDIFGYALHYYGNRDYKPVNSSLTVQPFADATAAGVNFKPLFNGNIGATSQNLPAVGTPLMYAYSYDVLNRLTGMQALSGLNTTTNAWTPTALQDFKETLTYDLNSNIKTYIRNGNNTFAGKPLAMDNLNYNYTLATNKLAYVTDGVSTTTDYDGDLESQASGSYVYDLAGRITKDLGSGANVISWNVYDKVRAITRTDGVTISYTYDATGNRISKTVGGVQTWYVRDAEGNVMSVYTKGDAALNNGDLTQKETHLYGISRLGINTLTSDVQSPVAPLTTNFTGLGTGININYIRGTKFFELSNHLGNILATVSDKKKGISTDSTTIDHYEADIVSAQEYYPFGMQMPGRGFNNSKYRYGFNGQEKSDEIDPTGNHNTAEFWEYDTRIGRRWNIDPKLKIGESPYSTFSGNPILLADPHGDTVIVNSSGAIISNNNIGTAVYVHHYAQNTDRFIGNLGGTIDADEIIGNLLDKNVKDMRSMMKIPIYGPYKFYRLVKNRGEWDYKSNKGYIYALANQFDKGNKLSTWFKYDQYLLTAADFGNFHYGVVGLATQFFSKPTLLEMAGRAQMQAKTSDPSYQKYKVVEHIAGNDHYYENVLQAPYGDDPEDQKAISKGFQFYMRKYRDSENY